MVSVSEASSIVNAHLFKPTTEKVDVADCCNKVLAEDIHADRDFPPFNRVAMDGIAIQHAKFDAGKTTFAIQETAAAGEPQKSLEVDQNCIEVMTGAPLPVNTDTVIRYEDIEIKGGIASIKESAIEKEQNVHPQAQDAKKGEVLLSKGIRISPAEVALIASVGKSQVEVRQMPKVAIVSTGNELVDVSNTPKPHQIRRSNSYALQSAFQRHSCVCTQFHLQDDKDEITNGLTKIIEQHDVIVLSGGVSKGKFDYVPDVLNTLGIEKHFHKVRQRPGKPFWFGSRGNKTVFALPGNPVSTFMCFYRYIEPWLFNSLGLFAPEQKALLDADFEFKDDNLTYFLQVTLKNIDGKLVATPIPGGGSGDFANLKEVSAFMELQEGRKIFKKGETYPVYSFR
ncbi:MAG: molybdopterin molybdotransferase MoeA [Cyclobacteriaceae bacterium]